MENSTDHKIDDDHNCHEIRHQAKQLKFCSHFNDKRVDDRKQGGLVLTIDGQPIDELKFEYAFRKARKAAGIKNFTFHDFRHCAITRWAAAGIPTAAAMLAAGHKSVQSHKKYQNLQRDEVKAAFQNLLTSRLHEKAADEKSAVSS